MLCWKIKYDDDDDDDIAMQKFQEVLNRQLIDVTKIAPYTDRFYSD